MLYVRDVLPAAAGATCSWPTRRSRRSDDGLLREARAGWSSTATKQTVELDARGRHAPHDLHRASPTTTTAATFDRLVISASTARRCFPRIDAAQGRQRDDASPSCARAIAESREARARRRTASASRSSRSSRFPPPALVLALIGLALGVSNRKDGKLASFVLGFGVIFVYYVLLWTSRAVAIGGRLPARPGAVDCQHRVRRRRRRAACCGARAPPISRSASACRLSGAAVVRAGAADRGPALTAVRPPRRASCVVVRIPHFDLPRPTPARSVRRRASTCGCSSSGVVRSLLGIFYISTFIDLADKLFRGTATTGDAAPATSISRRRSTSTTSFRWRRSWRRW